jgi:hypothetical protein
MFEKYKIKIVLAFYLPLIVLHGLLSSIIIYSMITTYNQDGFKFKDIPALMFYPSIIYLACFIFLYIVYLLTNSKQYESSIKNVHFFVQFIAIVFFTIIVSFSYDYLYFLLIDDNINNEIVDIAISKIDMITQVNQQEQIDEFNGLRNSPFFVFSFSFYLVGMCVITSFLIFISKKIFTKNQTIY